MGDFRIGLDPLDAEVDDTELEVTGTVPDWLSGTLVRNGPGRWTAQPGGRGERGRHEFRAIDDGVQAALKDVWGVAEVAEF